MNSVHLVLYMHSTSLKKYLLPEEDLSIPVEASARFSAHFKLVLVKHCHESLSTIDELSYLRIASNKDTSHY